MEIRRSIPVWPNADVEVLGSEFATGWSAQPDNRAEFAGIGEIHGRTAHTFVGEGLRNWQIEYIAADAFDALGYATLRFAFHPSETVSSSFPRFRVRLASITRTIPSFDTTSDGSEVPVTTVLEERHDATPDDFALAQNYPNPFNSGTVIRFSLPQSGLVELAIYNLAGQKVTTLVQGMRQAGSYAINRDGKDERGMALASGVYLYELRAGARIETRKLTLLL